MEQPSFSYPVNHLDFSFGGIQSPPDYRDVNLVAAMGMPEVMPVQYFIDLSQLPVWHQHKIGACTAHAIGKHQQKNEMLETNRVISLSPRFLYALVKAQDGLPAGYQGTYPRMVAKTLQKNGCATEKTVQNNTLGTYEDYIDLSAFPIAAYQEAKNYAIKSYAFINVHNPDELKAGVLNGGVSLLLSLGQEWWVNKQGMVSWAERDTVPVRPPKAIVSGHEVFVYGYDRYGGRDRFWFRNSWGDGWGRKGDSFVYFDEYERHLIEGITIVDLPDLWKEEVENLPPAEQFKHYFSRDLSYGEKSEEVRKLQIALKIIGVFAKTVKESGYFGDLTYAAVKAFQRQYNIVTWGTPATTGYGKVGPRTRQQLNLLVA